MRGWPVLHEGKVLVFDPHTWRLRVFGAGIEPWELDWEAFRSLPTFNTTQDIHCVTTWLRFDNRWGGVSVRELLSRVELAPEVSHVTLHGADDPVCTTNLALEDVARPENLLATHHDGAPLTSEHGGPMRFVCHQLYAWTSAKRLNGIEFMVGNRRGYWEIRGYHDHADPWIEERYSYQEEKTS